MTYHTEYYILNRERILTYQKTYNKSQRYRDYQKEYYLKHRTMKIEPVEPPVKNELIEKFDQRVNLPDEQRFRVSFD